MRIFPKAAQSPNSGSRMISTIGRIGENIAAKNNAAVKAAAPSPRPAPTYRYRNLQPNLPPMPIPQNRGRFGMTPMRPQPMPAAAEGLRPMQPMPRQMPGGQNMGRPQIGRGYDGGGINPGNMYGPPMQATPNMNKWNMGHGRPGGPGTGRPMAPAPGIPAAFPGGIGPSTSANGGIGAGVPGGGRPMQQQRPQMDPAMQQRIAQMSQGGGGGMFGGAMRRGMVNFRR